MLSITTIVFIDDKNDKIKALDFLRDQIESQRFAIQSESLPEQVKKLNEIIDSLVDIRTETVRVDWQTLMGNDVDVGDIPSDIVNNKTPNAFSMCKIYAEDAKKRKAKNKIKSTK